MGLPIRSSGPASRLVFYDGKQVMDAKDETFKDAGKVGVWTKADSVTYFDALSVKPLQ